MTYFVRLFVPRALFLISFRGFLTSDAIIGGAADVSGLIFFCEECRSWRIELYSHSDFALV